MTGRRQLAAVLGGIAAGAGLALLATSRVWVIEIRTRPAPLPPEEVTQTGASLVPAVPALALVALACAGGLIATRGVARRAVGVLLAAAGLGMAALLVAAAVRPGVSAGWAIAALAGAVVVVGAAGFAVRQADRWPTMGGRYGRASPRPASGGGANTPEPAKSDSEAALWDALDRGDDPTR